MFEDSGKSLKKWAAVLLTLSVIGFIIYAIVAIYQINKAGYEVTKLVLIALGVLVIEILGALVSAKMMYAIGDTHEKTDELFTMQQKLDKMLEEHKRIEKKLDDLKKMIPKESVNTNVPEVNVTTAEPTSLNDGSNNGSEAAGKNMVASSIVQKQSDKDIPKPHEPVVHRKVCPKCHQDNPQAFLFCQYCGEKLK